MNDNEFGREFFSRMFEGMPWGWEDEFHVGDTVRLTRTQLLAQSIPVGCEGVIEEIEHQESAMSAKGRPLYVRFDMAPYNIPLSDELRHALADGGISNADMPDYHVAISTNVGPNDIERVK